MSEAKAPAASPPDPRKSWPTWDCQVKPQKEPANVGTKMDMACQGEFVDTMLGNKLSIVFEPKELEYSLTILEVKNVENQRADFVVAGYRAGEFSKLNMYITDGQRGVQVKNSSWKVESVLDPSKKPEPFGPIGPLGLEMPWWYWASIGFAAFIVLAIVFVKIKKYFDRKRLIDQLARHGTALTPFNQFNKDLRIIVRNWQRSQYLKGQFDERIDSKEMVAEINKLLRQYLMRELLIPTFEWTDGQIMKELKKRHRPIFKEHREDLRRIFRELRRANQASTKVSEVDCEQLVIMSRNLTERVHAVKRKHSS